MFPRIRRAWRASPFVRVAVALTLVVLVALGGVGVTATGGDPVPAGAAARPAVVTTAAVSPSPSPVAVTPTAAPDPYAAYLAGNPRADLVLSREDAQTRAYLGCGQTFAAGTVDAVLAAAYRPAGLCNR